MKSLKKTRVKPNQRYKHYKGGEYIILLVARDSNTLENLVVYQGQYTSEEFGENPIWVRSLKEFTEVITREGKTFPRFSLM